MVERTRRRNRSRGTHEESWQDVKNLLSRAQVATALEELQNQEKIQFWNQVFDDTEKEDGDFRVLTNQDNWLSVRIVDQPLKYEEREKCFSPVVDFSLISPSSHRPVTARQTRKDLYRSICYQERRYLKHKSLSDAN